MQNIVRAALPASRPLLRGAACRSQLLASAASRPVVSSAPLQQLRGCEQQRCAGCHWTVQVRPALATHHMRDSLWSALTWSFLSVAFHCRSQATKANGLVFVSGSLGLDPKVTPHTPLHPLPLVPPPHRTTHLHLSDIDSAHTDRRVPQQGRRCPNEAVARQHGRHTESCQQRHGQSSEDDYTAGGYQRLS